MSELAEELLHTSYVRWDAMIQGILRDMQQ